MEVWPCSAFFGTHEQTGLMALVFVVSLSATPASSSSQRLGRGVLVGALRLEWDGLLRAGSPCSSSWSSMESQMDPPLVGLRLLVMEFSINSRILLGYGSSLKLAFCGVRLAFSANSSGFLISANGTRRCTHHEEWSSCI